MLIMRNLDPKALALVLVSAAERYAAHRAAAGSGHRADMPRKHAGGLDTRSRQPGAIKAFAGSRPGLGRGPSNLFKLGRNR